VELRGGGGGGDTESSMRRVWTMVGWWCMAAQVAAGTTHAHVDPYADKHAPSATAAAVERVARRVEGVGPAHTAEGAVTSGDGFPVSDQCVSPGCNSTAGGCHSDAAHEATTLAHLTSVLTSLPQFHKQVPPPQCCDQVRGAAFPCLPPTTTTAVPPWVLDDAHDAAARELGHHGVRSHASSAVHVEAKETLITKSCVVC
jgi:hypothetical protein